MGRLQDKVAVIVGGASGFGLATAERFAAEGAAVAVLGRRGELAAEVGERLGGSGHACDIADFDACLLYTSPSPRDGLLSRMPSSA